MGQRLCSRTLDEFQSSTDEFNINDKEIEMKMIYTNKIAKS